MHLSSHPSMYKSTYPSTHSHTDPPINVLYPLICPSNTHLPIYLPTPTHSSTLLVIHSSIHPTTHVSNHPSIYWLFHPYIKASTNPYIHSSIHQPINLLMYLLIDQFIHPSTHPYIHISLQIHLLPISILSTLVKAAISWCALATYFVPFLSAIPILLETGILALSWNDLFKIATDSWLSTFKTLFQSLTLPKMWSRSFPSSFLINQPVVLSLACLLITCSTIF